jgi:3-deoxy-D-manno-octulosonate 8-phosphate phosphatase (KDO 8-P phosphatase)
MPHAKPSDIDLLALDVDGVLTDGSIYLSDRREEIKCFNIRDGFGIRLWQRMGLKVAVVTGRIGHAVRHRCAELGITELVQGAKDKGGALAELVERAGVPAERIAFVGDDWPDLSIMRRVGYPIAVANADTEVLKIAAMVTKRSGGDGAVREAIEHMLAARGWMQRAVELYL